MIHDAIQALANEYLNVGLIENVQIRTRDVQFNSQANKLYKKDNRINCLLLTFASIEPIRSDVGSINYDITVNAKLIKQFQDDDKIELSSEYEFMKAIENLIDYFASDVRIDEAGTIKYTIHSFGEITNPNDEATIMLWGQEKVHEVNWQQKIRT